MAMTVKDENLINNNWMEQI